MGNEQSRGRPVPPSTNSNQAKTKVENAKHVKYNFLPQKLANPLKNLKGDGNEAKSNETAGKGLKAVKLLVIDGRTDENHYQLFKNSKLLDGRKIEVEQTGWSDFSLAYYSDAHNCVCNLRVPRKPLAKTNQLQFRTFIPDYCLV